MNRLVDRVLSRDVTELGGEALARAVRHGTESLAVRALGELAGREEDEARRFLEGLLGDPRIAVQSACFRGLARRADPRSAAPLTAASAHTDEASVHRAVALIRCGAEPEPLLAALERRDKRTFVSESGPRRLAFDVPALTERVQQELHDPVAIEAVLAALPSAGRREQHTLLMALGRTGDPRALPLLVSALRATDVDPGRGFTQRRLCATAIGRLGLREGTAILIRALSDEALDFEGRPGAGMGIQYPVRTNLLWALGELRDPTCLPTLLSYLANTSGSAFGGFYLAAMDALWKLGPLAVSALTTAARTAPDTAAAHAVGVLGALGEDVSPWINDPRLPVARVAAACR